MIYRGHLEQIAASVAKVNLADRRELAEDLAVILVLHNARFDRAKFFVACGVETKRAITLRIELEPMARGDERATVANAVREVAEMVALRGVAGTSGSRIYLDNDGNERGHVTTETRDV